MTFNDLIDFITEIKPDCSLEGYLDIENKILYWRIPHRLDELFSLEVPEIPEGRGIKIFKRLPHSIPKFW